MRAPIEIADRCPHYPLGVPDGHTCDAPILLVGERPGDHELEEGYVFAGPNGWQLLRLWEDAGCDPAWFYLTNIQTDTFERDRSHLSMVQLLRRLPALRAVVAAGSLALKFLTGNKRLNITTWRGTWMKSEEFGWLLPVLHPAYILRTPSAATATIFDWQKLSHYMTETRDGAAPPGPVVVESEAPSLYLDRVSTNSALPISVDIETSPAGIICVGFASPAGSGTWTGCSLQWSKAKDYIAHVCSKPNPKVLQNGLYDLYWLAHYGVEVPNFQWDVGLMHSALDPAHGHESGLKPFSLAYMANVYIGEPYYKHDTKDGAAAWSQSRMAKPGAMTALQEYNLRDCVVTGLLFEELQRRLLAAGKLNYYRTCHQAMIAPLFRLMRHGVRLDTRRAEATTETRLDDIADLRRAVAAAAGRPLWAVKVYKKKKNPDGSPFVTEGKSISTVLLRDYLYREQKLPRRTHQGNLTTDSTALAALIPVAEKVGKTAAVEVIRAVQRYREAEKAATWTGAGVADRDGRVRSHYRQTILTGRLSSASNPRGTGTNLQNIKKSQAQFFLPDVGRIFIACDLSLAEDRPVRALCGLPPIAPGQDVHSEFARAFYTILEGKDPGPISKKEQPEKRENGKRFKHANNYGLGPQRLQDIFEAQTKVRPTEQFCKDALEAAHLVQPVVRNVFQAGIREKLLTDGKLRLFTGREIDLSMPLRYAIGQQKDHIYKIGYAFLPQGTVGMLMNQRGVHRADEWALQRPDDFSLNLQIHDEIVGSIVPDPEVIFEYMADIRSALEDPVQVSITWKPGEIYEVVIPAEFTLRRTLDKQGQLSLTEETTGEDILAWLKI